MVNINECKSVIVGFSYFNYHSPYSINVNIVYIIIKWNYCRATSNPRDLQANRRRESIRPVPDLEQRSGGDIGAAEPAHQLGSDRRRRFGQGGIEGRSCEGRL